MLNGLLEPWPNKTGLLRLESSPSYVWNSLDTIFEAKLSDIVLLRRKRPSVSHRLLPWALTNAWHSLGLTRLEESPKHP